LKVSVCIPTYNAATTIDNCLRSVMNQSIPPFEILIVDGYSQDETLDILRKYKNVKVIASAKGIGRARKILAERASGEILAWIDADVVVPSNWLELHLKIHRENQSIQILSGRWYAFRPLLPRQTIPDTRCEITPIHEWLGITQAACTMKKVLFSSVIYDEKFRRAEEWDLMMAAHRKGIKSHYSKGLFAYHISKPRKRLFKEMIYAGNYVLFLEKYGLWYIKSNPRHFLTFLLRISLIYALPLSIIFPWALMSYPIALVAYLINFKLFGGYSRIKLKTIVTKLFIELVRGLGEHYHILNFFF